MIFSRFFFLAQVIHDEEDVINDSAWDNLFKKKLNKIFVYSTSKFNFSRQK